MFSPQKVCEPWPGRVEPQLARQQIHLYFSYPDLISNPQLLSRYAALLTANERARMSRFYFARNRHQYLVTRALIRTSLSAFFPVEPSEWRFDSNRYGKPGVSHPDTTVSIQFNLSHTQGLTVCAITRDHAIGVDVEDLQRPTQGGFSSLGSYFSARESEDLCKLPADQQGHRFFDYWTLKESYIKARGEGLAIPLDKFSFLFEGSQLKEFSVEPDLQDRADCWQFWRMALGDPGGAVEQGADRYRIALAIRSQDRDIRITAVNCVPLQGQVPLSLRFL